VAAESALELTLDAVQLRRIQVDGQEEWTGRQARGMHPSRLGRGSGRRTGD
jgi:hypothetical protein